MREKGVWESERASEIERERKRERERERERERDLKRKLEEEEVRVGPTPFHHFSAVDDTLTLGCY